MGACQHTMASGHMWNCPRGGRQDRHASQWGAPSTSTPQLHSLQRVDDAITPRSHHGWSAACAQRLLARSSAHAVRARAAAPVEHDRAVLHDPDAFHARDGHIR